MGDRIAARAVDLFLLGVAFAVMLLPIPILHGLVGDIGLGGSGGIDLAEYGLFFAVAAAASLGLEPFTLGVKRVASGRSVSVGKSATDLELRCVGQIGRAAPTGRAIGRYLLSVGACAAVIGLSFAVALVAEIGLTPWRVVGLTAIPSGVVWLTALLSALLRADRRGWHDVAAGTVLVSTHVPSPEHGSHHGSGG